MFVLLLDYFNYFKKPFALASLRQAEIPFLFTVRNAAAETFKVM
jgi:hypothetical protein